MAFNTASLGLTSFGAGPSAQAARSTLEAARAARILFIGPSSARTGVQSTQRPEKSEPERSAPERSEPERSAPERSAKVVEDVGDGLTDPREERGLHLGEETRLRVAETPDAVHERIQLVRLEGEDPFPVAETERARRVREDLRELPT